MFRLTPKRTLILTLVLFAAFAATLYFMGQPLICDCGYVKFWNETAATSQNSQHIADWYTLSHIIHGFAFYFLAYLIGRKRGWSVWQMLLAAILVEMAWEIFENSDLIINRYRAVTVSFDYWGDSVINSVSDVAAMALGFLLARRLPVWGTIVLIIALEIFTGLMIRDNLTLNIIMLIWPSDIVRNWQLGG